jgi:hypothetical protein
MAASSSITASRVFSACSAEAFPHIFTLTQSQNRVNLAKHPHPQHENADMNMLKHEVAGTHCGQHALAHGTNTQDTTNSSIKHPKQIVPRM